MSCAVILPITASTTPDEIKRSWGSFALQTYGPRILVLANAQASAACLVLMAEVERFFGRASTPGVYCTQAVLPRESPSIQPLCNLIDTGFLTVWQPGRGYHRDTLGHLSIQLASGFSGTVYCERSPYVFGVTMGAWERLKGETFLSADDTRNTAISKGLWRRIPPVADYTPARGI